MKFNISNIKAVFAVAALGAASCTANYEDINRNPYEVTGEEMERDGYAMRSFMTTMQSWVVPTDRNQCQFTDVLLGGPYGWYITDANSGFNTGKFSTYDPQSNWSPVFYRVVYTNEMSNYSELCKVTEDENAIAVAKVVKVAGVHRVTDTYGPIPYTQVGTGVNPVPLDSEKEVFKAMFADLDAAIEVLTRNRAGMISTDADRVYGGNLERWGRLANSLKLRLAMRIVYTDFTTEDGRTPQQLAEEAVASELGVIADNAGNAMYMGFGKDGNPFYVCFFSFKSGEGDHRIAADITSFMNGYADPRRASYFNESAFSGGGYVGLRNGIRIPDDERINRYSRYNVTASTSLMWMNASEVAFLRAEGALRGWAMGGDARSLYEQGIAMSFARFNLQGAEAYCADRYMQPADYRDSGGLGHSAPAQSSVTIAWNDAGAGAFEENLERIITQKWIANFPLGAEAWNDYRRTGYPYIFPAYDNRSTQGVTKERGQRRLRFSLNEYETNRAHVQAAASMIGGDRENIDLWWAKKN